MNGTGRRTVHQRAGWLALTLAVAAPSLQGQALDRAAGTTMVPTPGPALFVSDGGSGQGLPVVLVHSLAGNHRQWDAQIHHLRSRRRAVSFDLRGHGESQAAPDGDYSLDALTDDLGAVVDHLGLRRFTLVGHSLGAGVIATYAGRHPGRVAALLFVDPIGDQRALRNELDPFMMMLRGEAYQGTIEAYWRLILTNAREQVAESVLNDLRRTPQEAVIGGYDGLVTFDPVGALGTFDGKMLSVISDLNNFPFSLHRVVPGLPHRLVTGTSHWLQMDAADTFNQILDEFLDQLE